MMIGSTCERARESASMTIKEAHAPDMKRIEGPFIDGAGRSPEELELLRHGFEVG